MAWLRLYDDILENPKVQMLPDRAFRMFVNLLALTKKHHDRLPNDIEVIAFALRLPIGKARDTMQILVSAKLIEITENGYIPHGWNERQFVSDVSTERVRRFRKRQGNVSETAPEYRVQKQKQKQSTEKKVSSAEPSQASAPVASPVPVFISIPTNRKGEEISISEAEVLAFEELYQAVDVRQQLRNYRAWSLSNPDKRKTAGGVMRSVNAWLSKAQDRGGHNGNGKVSAHDKGTLGAALFLAADIEAGNGDRAGTLGDHVPSNGHGYAQVASPIRDVLGRSEASTSGSFAASLPRLPAK